MRFHFWRLFQKIKSYFYKARAAQEYPYRLAHWEPSSAYVTVWVVATQNFIRRLTPKDILENDFLVSQFHPRDVRALMQVKIFWDSLEKGSQTPEIKNFYKALEWGREMGMQEILEEQRQIKALKKGRILKLSAVKNKTPDRIQ